MQAIKRLILGTPLELPARYVHSRLTGNKNWIYDRQTFEVMSRVLTQHGSSFVDVGCNKGDILRHAVRISPTGRHWAFEPLPELHSRLKSEFSSVNVFNLALSDRRGETTFQHVISCPALSGLLKREMANSEHVETINITTDTLDNIIGNSRVDMIKIDVEGAELLVLRGAKGTIKRNKPVIVFEHGLGGADSYGHTPEQVFELLAECGMKVSTMKRWLHHDPPFEATDFAAHWRDGKDFYFIAYE